MYRIAHFSAILELHCNALLETKYSYKNKPSCQDGCHVELFWLNRRCIRQCFCWCCCWLFLNSHWLVLMTGQSAIQPHTSHVFLGQYVLAPFLHFLKLLSSVSARVFVLVKLIIHNPVVWRFYTSFQLSTDCVWDIFTFWEPLKVWHCVWRVRSMGVWSWFGGNAMTTD